MNKRRKPTEAQKTKANEKIGLQIIDFFQLDKNPDGRYDTSWGDKTLEGLGASITRIVKEQGKS